MSVPRAFQLPANRWPISTLQVSKGTFVLNKREWVSEKMAAGWMEIDWKSSAPHRRYKERGQNYLRRLP
jgi:hypothetical protein